MKEREEAEIVEGKVEGKEVYRRRSGKRRRTVEGGGRAKW